jgi:hypothetical protein
MNAENSTRILPYAQKIFERICRGKAPHSLLEYLNSPVLREELRKTVDLSGETDKFVESFYKKQLNFCEKKK